MVNSNRKCNRYAFDAHLDVSLGVDKQAIGRLIDISGCGIGFRASRDLNVGKVYLVSINGIGAYACRIKHCIEFNRYGGSLLIDDAQIRNLQAKLEEVLD